MDNVVVAVLVVCSVVGAVSASGTTNPLAFKSCGSLSSIQRCKVKAVEVDGCQMETSADWNHPPKEQNYIEDRKGNRNVCEVSKKSQLNFNITVHTGFSSSRLSSQFTMVDPLGAECVHCPAARRRDDTPSLFRAYVRDACRGARCPLTPLGPQTVTDYLKINPDSIVTENKITHKVQWKLWNNSNKKDNCCFIFYLKYY